MQAAESSLRPAAKGQHKPPTNNSRDVPASDYSPGGGPSGTDPNLNKLRRQATAAETNQLGSEEREEAVESIAGDRERLVVPPQSVKRVINNVENGARGKKSYGTVNFAAAGGTVERGLHLATPNFEQHVGEDEERENDKRTDKEESEESSVTAKKSEVRTLCLKFWVRVFWRL